MKKKNEVFFSTAMYMYPCLNNACTHNHFLYNGCYKAKSYTFTGKHDRKKFMQKLEICVHVHVNINNQ